MCSGHNRCKNKATSLSSWRNRISMQKSNSFYLLPLLVREWIRLLLPNVRIWPEPPYMRSFSRRDFHPFAQPPPTKTTVLDSVLHPKKRWKSLLELTIGINFATKMTFRVRWWKSYLKTLSNVLLIKTLKVSENRHRLQRKVPEKRITSCWISCCRHERRNIYSLFRGSAQKNSKNRLR